MTEETPDSELIAAYLAGDQDAFRALYDRHIQKVRGMASGLVRNPADCEEVVSAAFSRAAKNLHRFRGDSSFATWMIRIAMNLARNLYWHQRRRRHDQHVSIQSPVSAENETTMEEILPDTGEGIMDGLEREEIEELITGEVVSLQPHHRDILWLRLAHDMSYEDIASALKINAGTVKSRIARARGCLLEAIRAKHPSLSLNVA